MLKNFNIGKADLKSRKNSIIEFNNTKDTFKKYNNGESFLMPKSQLTILKPSNCDDDEQYFDNGDQFDINQNEFPDNIISELTPESILKGNKKFGASKNIIPKIKFKGNFENVSSPFQLNLYANKNLMKTPTSPKVHSQSVTQPDSNSIKEDILSTDRLFNSSKNYKYVRGTSATEEEISEYTQFCKRSLEYCLTKLKQPKEEIIMLKNVYFGVPQLNEKEKILILDLDESLISGDTTNYANSSFKISFYDEIKMKEAEIVTRPYLHEFLDLMVKLYEIHIFTATTQKYAEKIVKILDPDSKYFTKILSRHQCLETKKGLFIKDLRIYKGRDLKDIVIVDNFIHSFAYQLENGIPLFPWNGNPFDNELPVLGKLLLEASKYFDIRDFIREHFCLNSNS